MKPNPFLDVSWGVRQGTAVGSTANHLLQQRWGKGVAAPICSRMGVHAKSALHLSCVPFADGDHGWQDQCSRPADRQRAADCGSVSAAGGVQARMDEPERGCYSCWRAFCTVGSCSAASLTHRPVSAALTPTCAATLTSTRKRCWRWPSCTPRSRQRPRAGPPPPLSHSMPSWTASAPVGSRQSAGCLRAAAL